MRYFAAVGGQEHAFEVESGGRAPRVSREGRSLQVDLHLLAPGTYSLILGGCSHAVQVQRDGDLLRVTVDGHVHAVKVEDIRERATSAFRRTAPGAGTMGDGAVRSLIPGVVVKLLVSEGDRVESGQPLAVLEAMKMQNEVRAPASGRVARLHASPGQSVAGGSVLLWLEASRRGD